MSIVRYLNSTDPYPERITKADKELAERLDFKDIKFPAKISGIHKIEKENHIGISAFVCENKKKNIQSMYQKKRCEKKNMLVDY